MKSIGLAVLLSLAPAFAQDLSIASIGYVYPQPVAVAPGQVLTVFVPGATPGDVSVTVQQQDDFPAPVLDIRPALVCADIVAPCPQVAAVTVQIPFEVIPTCFSCAVVQGFGTGMFVKFNGVAGPPFTLTPLPDRVHFLTTCDTVISGGSGMQSVNGLPCQPYVTHADGSLVSSQGPAAAEEVLVAYAVGLGATNPAVATGQAAPAAVPTAQTFTLDFNYHPNALPAKPVPPPPGAAATRYSRPLFAGMTAGFVGLYQVNFVVPPPAAPIAACTAEVQTNLTVSMGAQYSFDGVGICVAP